MKKNGTLIASLFIILVVLIIIFSGNDKNRWFHEFKTETDLGKLIYPASNSKSEYVIHVISMKRSKGFILLETQISNLEVSF